MTDPKHEANCEHDPDDGHKEHAPQEDDDKTFVVICVNDVVEKNGRHEARQKVYDVHLS